MQNQRRIAKRNSLTQNSHKKLIEAVPEGTFCYENHAVLEGELLVSSHRIEMTINMRPRVQLVVVGIVALLLGLAIAYPLYTSNVQTPPKYLNRRAYLGLDVVYAYFSTQPVSQNIAGLWRNSSDPASGYTRGSFFVVLNVTNYSNVSVVVSKLSVIGAQQMSIINTPDEFSESVTGDIFFEYHRTYSEQVNVGAGDDVTWQPSESRLIGLSGVNQISNRTLLQTGTFYLGGTVVGTSIDGPPSESGGAKLVHMENFGSEFLYNDLVQGNETLRVYPTSLDVQVVSGS
jgi:hypothetical protein